MAPSMCATSANSSQLQKTLIVHWISSKIQVRGTTTFVRLKALPLRPELTNRCPSWHILNNVLNPSKLADLLAEDRFTKLRVESIRSWVAWRVDDRLTWSIYVLVFSSIWEASQGVTVASLGSLVGCVCTCASELLRGKLTEMWPCFPHP